jgi:hypothetical protein
MSLSFVDTVLKKMPRVADMGSAVVGSPSQVIAEEERSSAVPKEWQVAVTDVDGGHPDVREEDAVVVLRLDCPEHTAGDKADAGCAQMWVWGLTGQREIFAASTGGYHRACQLVGSAVMVAGGGVVVVELVNRTRTLAKEARQ